MPEISALPHRIHLVGIGGEGMTAIAQYLADMGCAVSGSDIRQTPAIRRLADGGVRVFTGQTEANVAGAQLVVASDAVPHANAELSEARTRDIPIMRRAAFLNLLSRGQVAVFVAGAHGKSTTTSMIAHVLHKAGRAPNFVIGAEAASLENRRGHFQNGEIFVCEACEAFQNLAPLRPMIAVVTNIDDDHLEHYGDQAGIDRAFHDFAASTQDDGAVIVNGDDPGIKRALASLDRPVSSFGLAAHNALQATDITHTVDGCCFAVRLHGIALGPVRLLVPGQHTVLNALACVAACLRLGVMFADIANALASFGGVGRRWQSHSVPAGMRLVDDYAHHPTELRACIETALAVRRHGQRLVIAFQPQLVSRTRRLFREFADILSRCDHVLLLDIDQGGERLSDGTSAALIGNAIREDGGRVDAFDDVDDLVERIGDFVGGTDFLLIAGAGSIRTAAPRVGERLLTLDHHAPRRQKPAAPVRPVALSPPRSQTAHPPQAARTVVDLFDGVVRNRPGDIAVSEQGRTLSFGALDEASDAMARWLAAKGSGLVVGVSLPSSIELVIVIVAVAKAGAVYVPLDPSLPGERMAYMLSTAKASLLITQRHAPADLAMPGIAKLYPQDGAPAAPEQPPKPPTSQNHAYICFTSGSTGKPKAVAIRHSALFALVCDIIPRFSIGAGARTALNTCISFDVSLGEIWMTLAGGGQLCTTASRKPLVGARLADFLASCGVTHLAVTASVLRSIPDRNLPALSAIICAGEPSTTALVERWAPGRRFFNAYGPTEATVYATVAICRPGRVITIGRGLAHMKTHVLDDRLRPVWRGQIGELCLAGAGVADGYLDIPRDDTGPFCDLVRNGRSEPIYRTGDLVRKRWNGALQFIGRRDQQVKILGNRIEVEEIEHAAMAQPGIADAAVAVHTHDARSELVCFVRGTNGAVNTADLRDRLAAWLPSYMVPAHIVPVLDIPLTPSGKKDRRGLLAAQGPHLVRQASFAPARTDTERQLSSIWQDILEQDHEVGVYDDFAALGGDSLRSLMLIGEIETRFAIDVPPGWFDRFTTITDLAVRLEELLWRETDAGAEPAAGFLGTRIYAQQRHLIANWSGARLDADSLILSHGAPTAEIDLFVCVQSEEEILSLAEHLGPDIRVHGMRSGHLVMTYSDDNVTQLTTHYLGELQRIAPRGRVVIAGICQGGSIARAMATALAKMEHPICLLVLIEQSRLAAYDGAIAFFYSEESYLNPVRRFDTGAARFDEIYGDRHSIDIVPGLHGKFHEIPQVRAFADQLRHRLGINAMAAP